MAAVGDIEGVGKVHDRRLATIGIRTTARLLREAGTRAGRRSVATRCEVPESVVLGWVNRADLFRIRGIARQYSDLLEASGVDTVKELATRRADHLVAALAEVNAQRRLVRRVPTETMVTRWIANARDLPQAVFH